MGQHFLFQAVNSLPTDAQRVIAAECQLWEHDTDMQNELKRKKETKKLQFFSCKMHMISNSSSPLSNI